MIKKEGRSTDDDERRESDGAGLIRLGSLFPVVTGTVGKFLMRRSMTLSLSEYIPGTKSRSTW